MTPEDLVGLLAEPARLRLLAAVALGVRTDADAASMPAQASRRREVLDHVASTTFTPGEQYGEAAVDERLRQWCAGGAVDHAALRRSLVEGGHLVRGSGIYALPSDEPPPLAAGERLVAGLGLS